MSDKPVEDVVYHARWYHDRLNPIYKHKLLKRVSDATDLSIRRSNSRVGNAFHDISSKLEILQYHAKCVHDRVKTGKKRLRVMLDDLQKDIGKNARSREIHLTVCRKAQRQIEFYDYILTANLEAVLVQAKALLDSLAQFYSLAFNRKIKGFSAKGVKLLRDLQSLPADLDFASTQIRSLVLKAKGEWIDRAVEYRDEVVHFGQLRGFRSQVLPLKPKLYYESAEVHPPKMPDGELVIEYVDSIVSEAHAFSEGILRIIFAHVRGSTRPHSEEC